jgi:hypothetical protein
LTKFGTSALTVIVKILRGHGHDPPIESPSTQNTGFFLTISRSQADFGQMAQRLIRVPQTNRALRLDRRDKAGGAKTKNQLISEGANKGYDE